MSDRKHLLGLNARPCKIQVLGPRDEGMANQIVKRHAHPVSRGRIPVQVAARLRLLEVARAHSPLVEIRICLPQVSELHLLNSALGVERRRHRPSIAGGPVNSHTSRHAAGSDAGRRRLGRLTTMTGGGDAYLTKSAEAGRMGKAAEFLVAAFCILATRGQLNASTSLVDDEGVDLVFHNRGGVSTLAVQVKARMSDSRGVERGSFLAQVRQATFKPRADLDMLFVAVDIDAGSIIQAWLVPSAEFRAILGEPNNRGLFRFTASMKPGTQDRWRPYRLDARQLPTRIQKRLAELDASGR